MRDPPCTRGQGVHSLPSASDLRVERLRENLARALDLPEDVVSAALNGDAAAAARVLACLLADTKKLRDEEAKAGAAPVRRGQMLSRIERADTAVISMEALGDSVPRDLVNLVAELFGVTRHREFFEKKCNNKFFAAAKISAEREIAGEVIGVRELAREVGVTASTVSRWRSSSLFRSAVNDCKKRIA